ncbi:TetR/AcrR family transcriptional regulator [Apilactobacillus micheneri]|uniref:TetR/AcrR family transcriptional regulator n=1 Tax=Apilactobacillus micheneri TaxID=1899430 RepID=UPI000D507E72|nr:TetR/AcrR family transcriptional regulator [Apilactobacillus micheneri]GAY80305.1 hypothetical protein NBRC113063_01177 [Apilactobacillus micheneri]
MNSSKDKISYGFLKIISLRSPFNITTENIIDISGVSRRTVYNAFNSKDEICEYILTKITNKITLIIKKAKKSFLNYNKEKIYINMIIKSIIEQIHFDRNTIINVYRSTYMGALLEKRLEVIYHKAFDFIVSDRFQLDIFIILFIDLTKKWISQSIPKSPVDFHDEFISIKNNYLKNI